VKHNNEGDRKKAEQSNAFQRRRFTVNCARLHENSPQRNSAELPTVPNLADLKGYSMKAASDLKTNLLYFFVSSDTHEYAGLHRTH
jgi:hypothetical protein